VSALVSALVLVLAFVSAEPVAGGVPLLGWLGTR
jgi:hypothetical protein